MRFLLLFKNFGPGKIICKGFFFLLLLVALDGGAQQVSLTLKEASLESVFSEIKKQTGTNFVYTSEEIKKSKPVTLTLRNVALKEALNQIFQNQPLGFTLEENYVVIHVKPEEPRKNDYEIRGKVVDEKGEGISSASIRVKDTKEGTATDDAGNFLIKSEKENIVLQISSVGFENREVLASASRVQSIELKTEYNQLDETVVIAYGTTTRRLNTGTVSKVKSVDIEKQPVTNPLLALSGRVAGLQVIQTSGVPGGNVTVLLRGRNSIANGNNPLYIIDGVPFTSTSLNSSYGGGAGGFSSPLNNINPLDIESIEVLKDADATAIYGSRGANGVILITTKKSNSDETTFEINAYKGVGKPSRFIKLLNSSQYLEMRKEAFKNDGVVPTLSNARDLILWDTTRYTDWQKVLIGNTATLTNVNARISGGSSNTKFGLGIGYNKETTPFPGEFGVKKLSGNYYLSHTTNNKKLNLVFHGTYMFNDHIMPQTDLSVFITTPPVAPAIYDSLGNLNWENSTWTNPLSNIKKLYKTTTENVISNLSIEWKIIDRLEFKTTIGYNNIRMNEHITTPYASYNPAFHSTALVYAGFGNNSIKTFISEPQLHFNTKVGMKNKLQFLIGSTFQQNVQNMLLQTGYGYLSDEMLDNLKAASTISINNYNITNYKYFGFFTRFNLNFEDKYLMSLTGRRDGSSRFGPSNRFSNFGSAGFGWIFSKEKFLSNSNSFLSFGKLKTSIGITGNDQIGDYKYLDTYSSYTYSYQNISTIYPTQLFNPDFGWEKVLKTEAGLDIGLLKNRLLLNLNYYFNTTSNQLVQYPLPQVTGFSGILMNLPATINNYGWEIDLNTINVQTKNWNWASSVTLTVPKNVLKSFPDLENSTYANTYVVGQSLFIAKRYHYLHVDPQTGISVFQDYDNDGRISSPNDQKAVVFTGQQFYGGLQNVFKFKNLELSSFFQFVKQKSIANYLLRFSRPGVMSNQPVFIMDRWQKLGDETSIQKFSNSNSAANTAFGNLSSSDAGFSDASFIRLKNISLSYNLPNKIIDKAKISGIKIFMYGQNLFTLTKYAGLDPETRAVLPPLKIVTGGINIFFK